MMTRNHSTSQQSAQKPIYESDNRFVASVSVICVGKMGDF